MDLRSLKYPLRQFGLPLLGITILFGMGVAAATRWAHEQSDKTPPTDKVVYDNALGCKVVNLEPGKKLTSWSMGPVSLYYSARKIQEGESVGPDLAIMRTSPGTDSAPDCAYIIREHALPATSASR